MEWMQRLNQSIEYIEEHITEELDYEKVAQVAGCPSYYFQQMFLYMTNMTLREYIRRRRLSLAAVELQRDSGKVIDIAVKYRYESPSGLPLQRACILPLRGENARVEDPPQGA